MNEQLIDEADAAVTEAELATEAFSGGEWVVGPGAAKASSADVAEQLTTLANLWSAAATAYQAVADAE